MGKREIGGYLRGCDPEIRDLLRAVQREVISDFDRQTEIINLAVREVETHFHLNKDDKVWDELASILKGMGLDPDEF